MKKGINSVKRESVSKVMGNNDDFDRACRSRKGRDNKHLHPGLLADHFVLAITTSSKN
jgi:hypothetical protein